MGRKRGERQEGREEGAAGCLTSSPLPWKSESGTAWKM